VNDRTAVIITQHLPWAAVDAGRDRRVERSHTPSTCLYVRRRWCEDPTVGRWSTCPRCSKGNNWTDICTSPQSPPASRQASTTTAIQQSFYSPLSGTTRESRYQKKNSPTHHPDYHPIFISFFHLLWSIASSTFKLRAWQSFCTTSFRVLFGLPLGLEPSTWYSIHFFTQSVSSFRNTCPYHCNLFCCSYKIISSIPRLSLKSLPRTLSFTLTLHTHLTSKLANSQHRAHNYCMRNVISAITQ